jgi:hypothetical protein
MADEKLSSLDSVIAFRYWASFPRRVLLLHMALQLSLSAEGLVAALDLALYFAFAGAGMRRLFRLM